MFAKILNALRAFPILANACSSVSPVLLITLPKYVKDVTSSMLRLLMVICSFDLPLILMIFVLSVLMLSTNLDEIALSLEVFACI